MTAQVPCPGRTSYESCPGSRESPLAQLWGRCPSRSLDRASAGSHRSLWGHEAGTRKQAGEWCCQPGPLSGGWPIGVPQHGVEGPCEVVGLSAAVVLFGGGQQAGQQQQQQEQQLEGQRRPDHPGEEGALWPRAAWVCRARRPAVGLILAFCCPLCSNLRVGSWHGCCWRLVSSIYLIQAGQRWVWALAALQRR